MIKPKDKEQEAKKAEEMLDSVPDHVVLSAAVDPHVTLSKLIYLLIKRSQVLNNLTIALIVLTVVLALLTIANVIVFLFTN